MTKLKIITIASISIILVICILLVSVTFLKVPIAKGKILKEGRPLFNLFFEPKDLYELTLNEKIDITDANGTQMFTFTNKYIGPYSVGFLWEKFVPDDYASVEKLDFKLRLKFDCYENNILLMSKEIEDYEYKFLGLSEDGIALFEFNSPDTIPIDTEISCKVTILVADELFNNKYGPVKIYIQKSSEMKIPKNRVF